MDIFWINIVFNLFINLYSKIIDAEKSINYIFAILMKQQAKLFVENY